MPRRPELPPRREEHDQGDEIRRVPTRLSAEEGACRLSGPGCRLQQEEEHASDQDPPAGSDQDGQNHSRDSETGEVAELPCPPAREPSLEHMIVDDEQRHAGNEGRVPQPALTITTRLSSRIDRPPS